LERICSLGRSYDLRSCDHKSRRLVKRQKHGIHLVLSLHKSELFPKIRESLMMTRGWRGLPQSATICSVFHGTAPIYCDKYGAAPEGQRVKRDASSVPAPCPWFEVGGVIMALGEFGVAPLEETPPPPARAVISQQRNTRICFTAKCISGRAWCFYPPSQKTMGLPKDECQKRVRLGAMSPRTGGRSPRRSRRRRRVTYWDHGVYPWCSLKALVHYGELCVTMDYP